MYTKNGTANNNFATPFLSGMAVAVPSVLILLPMYHTTILQVFDFSHLAQRVE